MACPLLRGIGSAAHSARYPGRGRIAQVSDPSVPREGSFPELSSSSSNFPRANKVSRRRTLATPRDYERPKRCPPWMRRRSICRGVQGKGLEGYSQIFRNPGTCRTDVEHRT
jgi:hypothetical protein